MSSPRTSAVVVLLTGTLLLAACGGGGDDAPASSPSPSASPLVLVDTLDGKPPPEGPVVVIKVDNSPSARPLQSGFAHAPIVYQEIVEGGATRFAAVFAGPSADDVGPVRSARVTDIDLLAQYGPVIFGSSGANKYVRADVEASDLISVPQERYADAYTMRGRRTEAYNFFTSPERLIDAAPDGGASVRDIGLRFGPQSAGARPMNGTATVTFNSSSYVTFGYDKTKGTWPLTQNGRPMALTDGATVTPDNIVVQFVEVVPGKYHDVLGNNSPETHTVGSGRVVVFRDGSRFVGRWKRSEAAAGTELVGKDGNDIKLKAGGQTWVLLVPTDGKVSIS